MRPKTIFAVLGLAVTINNLIQAYPKYQRNKLVMNLSPEKVYTTEKPIEVRKNTLFPKNTKKYVVTERPLPRMTTPSSYKYFLVKRPLMLKFDPLDKQPSRYNTSTVTHQSLMNKIKFVVSTPSPSEQDNKQNHWENSRPIHIKGNKDTKETMDNQSLSETLILNENMDTVTPPPFVKVVTSKNPTDTASENKTKEIIILPVNQEELKANPNATADEVKDIIAFLSKIQTSEANKTNKVTQQPNNKEMTKTSTLPPTTEVTKNSSTKAIIELKSNPINNQTNQPLKQMSTENGKKDVYIIPETDLIKPNTSSGDNKTTTLSPVDKSEKSTEFSKPEIVFISLNLSDLKSHPNLIADEVQNIVDNINKHVMTENNATTTVATKNTSSSIAISTTTPQTTFTTAPTTTSSSTSSVDRTTQEKEITAEPEKNIKSTEGELLSDNKSHNTNNDIRDVIYHVLNDSSRSNGEVTTEKNLQTTVEEEVTSNSSTEILFIPVNLDELKSNPNLIADEIKSIAKSRNKNVLSTIESPIITSTEVTSRATTTTTSTTSTPTTTTASTVFLTESTTKAYEISTLEKLLRKPSSTESVTEVTSKYSKEEPEIVFIPVNIEEFKTNPSGIINEIQNIVDKMKKDDKNQSSEKSTINQDNQTTFKKPFNEITSEKSFIEKQNDNSRKNYRLNMITEYMPTTNEIITEPPTTIQAVVSPLTVSIKNVSMKNSPTSERAENLKTTENITDEPEVIFIPLNLNDLQSNPAVADEVKDIVNYMNKIHPHNNATTAAPDLKKKITGKSDLPAKEVTKNSFSTPTQKTLATKNYFSTSIPNETSTLSMKTEATTLSSVKSTSDGIKNSTPTNKDQVTLRSQEIVFIPISLEELESNPDLVVDEVKNVVSHMNDKNKGGFKNLTSEQFSTQNTSAKTTTCSNSFYCPENKTKTYLKTEATENVTPKYIFIEPLEVTALKDDDDDDIYVGKPFHKQNDSEKWKQEARNGKNNSISDDISDVIYVIKKNKNT